MGAVREPGPTPQVAAATPTIVHAAIHTTSRTTSTTAPHSNTGVGFLPVTQGLGVPTTDPLPLDLGFPMGAMNFDPSHPTDLFSVPSASVFAPGAAASLYENDAQNFRFSPFATLGPTTSAYIPPSNGGLFDPYHTRTDYTTATATAQTLNSSLPSAGQKRVVPPVPAQDKRIKRRKLDTGDKHLEVNARNGNPSISLPAANQGPTNAIIPPLAVPSFDCPNGMSRETFVRLLREKLAAEVGASALDG